VARMARDTGFLVVKPEAKRPLGRLSHRWDDNIKIDLQEIKWAWTRLILVRLGKDGELF